jgi:hypothetical protein
MKHFSKSACVFAGSCLLVFALHAPLPAQVLNDTGIVLCADIVTYGPCTPQLFGQDAQFGRDALGTALVKTGAGSAGFDFTKISNSGQSLPSSSELGFAPGQWGCTRDNLTGLTWEVKVNDPSNFRHRSHRYNWFRPDVPDGRSGSQGGVCGTLGGQLCNTSTYRAAVNAAALCGASDWRVPTIEELQSIMHYSGRVPAIDGDYFPNIVADSTIDYYWSNTPSANTSNVWAVVFADATVDFTSRDVDRLKLILVRGVQ